MNSTLHLPTKKKRKTKLVAADKPAPRKRKQIDNSPLFQIKWLRVILDEAHVIRDHKTRQSQAAAALHAERRWAVTGTPFQNKVDDAFGLLRFLHLEPFHQLGTWTKVIMRPLKNRDKRGMERLQMIMGAICLRRKKTEKIHGKLIVSLPSKTQRVRMIDLMGKELELYNALASSGKQQFGRMLREEKVLQNYAYVLEILLRMRQACDHVRLVPERYHSAGFENLTQDALSNLKRLSVLLEESVPEDCSICLSDVEDPVITPCCHFFCSKCLKNSLLHAKTCPLCRSPIDEQFVVTKETAKKIKAHEERVEQDERNRKSNTLEFSSKILALFDEMERSRLQDPTCKSVVFSQWTGMLDILEQCFRARSIGFARLDGRMSERARREALRSFREDPRTKVFLISLKAGGVGLNLTAANKVYLFDPWWNPSAEDQAVDRVHRLGQTKDVEIVRFCVRHSVEERILELQAKKREMVANALVRLHKRQETREERLQDLVTLFS